jgi:hypothetical protein
LRPACSQQRDGGRGNLGMLVRVTEDSDQHDEDLGKGSGFRVQGSGFRVQGSGGIIYGTAIMMLKRCRNLFSGSPQGGLRHRSRQRPIHTPNRFSAR